MNNYRQLIVDLFAVSLCVWGMYMFYTILRIKRFIVRRYEIETNLARSIYFSYYMPFVKFLPDFFSSGFYAFHLLSFIWCWKVIKFIKEKRPKVGYFDDIDSPKEITEHFTEKEISLIKRPVIACFAIIFHALVYYVLKFFCPEVLN